jgi:hypothetical protein
MARRNPYAMDPALMQGVSNLTRALIGSAADDASLARGRASDALAGKYNAETEGLGIKNQDAKNLQSAVADASTAEGILAQSILASMGGQMNNGNLIQAVPQGGPQMSVPMNANQVNVSQADQLKGLAGLARSFFGDMTYSPDQFAGGLENLQDSKARSLATTLAQGSDDQRRQAMTMIGKSPGQYFDSGVAQTGLANTLTAAMDKNAKGLEGTKYSSDNTLKGTDNKTAAQFGAGGQGDRDTAANNVAAGREDDLRFGVGGQGDRDATSVAKSKVDVANIGATVDREKNEMDDKTTRWKHENRTISMSVEPGKQIVLDAATGKKLGIQPTMVTDGGETVERYILDGGEAAGKVKVSVPEGGTVFMDKPTADALGIKPDADGNYVIKGPPKTSTSAATDKRKRPAMDKINQAYSDDVDSVDGWADIPNAVRAMVKGTLLGFASKGMTKNQDMDYTTAYATAVSGAIRQGVIQIDTGYNDGLSDFAVPAFFYNADDTQLKDLGYSKAQIAAIGKQKEAEAIAKQKRENQQ